LPEGDLGHWSSFQRMPKPFGDVTVEQRVDHFQIGAPEGPLAREEFPEDVGRERNQSMVAQVRKQYVRVGRRERAVEPFEDPLPPKRPASTEEIDEIEHADDSPNTPELKGPVRGDVDDLQLVAEAIDRTSPEGRWSELRRDVGKAERALSA
jgi:hypothetical protein